MSNGRDLSKSNPFARPTLTSLSDSLVSVGSRITPPEPSMKITRVGLEGEAKSFEEWQAFGEKLRDLEGGIQWAIGDWINQGERRWGDKYAGIAEALGFEQRTLEDYAYVASNVQFTVRTVNLTWSHHKLVASLHEDDQREWLYLAENDENGKWSVARLRSEIADETAPKQLEAATPPTFITPHAASVLKKLAKLTPEKVAAMDNTQLREARQQYEMLINAAERVRRAIQEREQALKLEASKRGQW